jgi:hypothetical protein
LVKVKNVLVAINHMELRNSKREISLMTTVRRLRRVAILHLKLGMQHRMPAVVVRLEEIWNI